MPDFIDIHSHLNFKDYDADRADVISRLQNTNTWTITVGTDFESSKSAVELAQNNPSIFACVGLHPADNSAEIFDDTKYAELLKSERTVAIGECGLDYFRISPENAEEVKKRQKEIFQKQIEMAIVHSKPLMIHCREAYDDVHDVLASYKKEHGEKVRGNMHFFAGNTEIARKFLDLGFTLSFTGVITFARSYDEVIRFAPQDMIMSETDAPFVAPQSQRGKRNEPSFVAEIVASIAEIREEPVEEVKKALISNAFRVFSLPPSMAQ